MWQVAEAKNKFSELLNRTDTEGAQRVTRRGRTYVVLSEAEYDALSGSARRRLPFGEFLVSGPSFEGVDLSRDRSPPREINLGVDE